MSEEDKDTQPADDAAGHPEAKSSPAREAEAPAEIPRSGRRLAFSGLRRAMTDAELTNSGVQKLLLLTLA